MRMTSMLLALLLASVGCATQQSVDELNARVTKLESTKAENKAELKSALDSAENDRLNCRSAADAKFNSWLEDNGTPKKDRPGMYTASESGLKQAHDEEDKGYADCQREYEDAVQAAKLKFSE